MKLSSTVIAICLTLLSAANVFAVLVTEPSSLNPGDKYRLAFVTSGGRNAVSGAISDYNTFVTGAANAVPELLNLGTTWTAIASTSTVDARDNTNTVPSTVSGGSLGVPIFLLNDTKLADSNDDLWDGSIDVAFDRTELDTALINVRPWTGTSPDGTANSGTHLGPTAIATPRTGATELTNNLWIEAFLSHRSDSRPLYAISGELTVVPEPSAFLCVGLVASAVALARRNRSSRSTA